MKGFKEFLTESSNQSVLKKKLLTVMSKVLVQMKSGKLSGKSEQQVANMFKNIPYSPNSNVPAKMLGDLENAISKDMADELSNHDLQKIYDELEEILAIG